jgi:hypothetical protein
LLAHAGGAPETISIVLLFGGIWVGWAGWSRIKRRGFPRMPIGAAYGLIGAAVVLALAAGIVPPLIYGPAGKAKPPTLASGARPASTATISIVSPRPGQVETGPEMEVLMTLPGGQIIDTTSTRLTPNQGHIHLSIDGTLVSMTYGLVQTIPITQLSSGSHTLLAEFVAADHGPFDPRVQATVTFVVQKAGSA